MLQCPDGVCTATETELLVEPGNLDAKIMVPISKVTSPKGKRET